MPHAAAGMDRRVNTSLVEDFVRWCRTNQNTIKSKEMVVDFSHSSTLLLAVSIDEVNVEMFKSFKYLEIPNSKQNLPRTIYHSGTGRQSVGCLVSRDMHVICEMRRE